MNLKELVEYITKALVENPDDVTVGVTENADSVAIEVHVAPTDMGRVIGKGGRIANSVRVLARIAAMRHGKRATLDIV
ncbi:MAG: KH domain-containing protein [Chloroflexi bacterium]|nr:KH domain-containing protein [Chloroflexota bacterium]